MERGRKPRIDSKEEQARIIGAAHKVILPPAHVPLDEFETIFFNSVIAEFAKAEWTAHQLEIAAMMARTMARMTKEQELLKDEGAVMRSIKGTPVVNPRQMIVQQGAASIMNFRRTLSLNAQAKGPIQARGKSQEIARQTEAAATSVDDDYLARPN